MELSSHAGMGGSSAVGREYGLGELHSGPLGIPRMAVQIERLFKVPMQARIVYQWQQDQLRK